MSVAAGGLDLAGEDHAFGGGEPQTGVMVPEQRADGEIAERPGDAAPEDRDPQGDGQLLAEAAEGHQVRFAVQVFFVVRVRVVVRGRGAGGLAHRMDFPQLDALGGSPSPGQAVCPEVCRRDRHEEDDQSADEAPRPAQRGARASCPMVPATHVPTKTQNMPPPGTASLWAFGRRSAISSLPVSPRHNWVSPSARNGMAKMVNARLDASALTELCDRDGWRGS